MPTQQSQRLRRPQEDHRAVEAALLLRAKALRMRRIYKREGNKLEMRSLTRWCNLGLLRHMECLHRWEWVSLRLECHQEGQEVHLRWDSILKWGPQVELHTKWWTKIQISKDLLTACPQECTGCLLHPLVWFTCLLVHPKACFQTSIRDPQANPREMSSSKILKWVNKIRNKWN